MKINMSKKAHYLEHIEKQKESGVSISEYCRLNELSKHSFRHYRRQKFLPEKQSTFAKVMRLHLQGRLFPCLKGAVDGLMSLFGAWACLVLDNHAPEWGLKLKKGKVPEFKVWVKGIVKTYFYFQKR